MPFAIELFFNPPLENRFRRLCGSLRELELGGTVLVDDVKARPHVTLAICDDADEDRMCAVVEELSHQVPAHPVAFSSLGIFPGDETVLFLSPVMSEELMSAHRAVHRRVHEFSSTPWNLYQPNRWVAHASLALKLPHDGLRVAVDTILENVFPVTGEIVELGVGEFVKGVVTRYVCTYGLV